MKTFQSIIAVLLGLALIYVSPVGAQTVPTITSFAPTSGPVGTTVTITGTNFDPIAANNIVYFGATKGTVTAATTMSVAVTVPVGATFKPISVTVNGLTAYSAQPFVVTFASGGTDPLAFGIKVDFSIESNSGGVVLQDFDGDGKVDVAVSNTTANTVSIFRNTSSAGTMTTGSFAAKVDFAVGCSPSSLIAADVDGDGKLDLAWINASASKIEVMRNSSTVGALSFETKKEYSCGTGPVMLTAGDMDGDGQTDLILVRNTFPWGVGSMVEVLANTGSVGNVSFVSALGIPPAPGEGLGLVLCDIDGDGKPDVISTRNADRFHVWRNISMPGSILIAAPLDFITTDYTSGAVGDFDGDGKPDVVLTKTYGSPITSVFRNTSTSGSITFDPRVDFTGGADVNPAVSDLNGDGKLDIVITNSSNSRVSIFRNTSTPGIINTGSFAPKVDFNVGAGPNGVEVGDVDGDGVPDIVCSNSTGNSFSVLRSEIVDTRFAITSFAPTSGPVGTTVIITGTKFDPLPSNNIVYFGATKGTVTAATTTSVTVTVPVGATFKPISLTKNGGLTAYSAKPFVVTFASGGIDPLAFGIKVDFSIESNSGGVVLQDFDGDGKADVAVSNTTLNAVSIFRNTSTPGTMTAGSFATKVDFAVGCSPSSLIAADVDGDGKLDLAWINASASKIEVMRNSSTVGALSFETKKEYSCGTGPVMLTAGDMDGDGQTDLILVRNTFPWGVGSMVEVLANTGSVGNVSFVSALGIPPAPGEGLGLVLCDIDGDGKPDVISTRNADRFHVWRNISMPGSILIAAPLDFITTDYTSGAVGDFDGDGKPDVVLTKTYGSPITSVFRNTSTSGSITFDPRVDFTGGADVNPAVSDLNGDGKLDIVITNSSNSRVSIFRNTSTPGIINTGSFAPKVDFNVGAGPNGVEVGDVDGDGVPDIVCSNSTGNSFSVLRNNLVYVIAASASSGGSIVPNGSVAVARTASQSFTITPDPAYLIAHVLVDGVEQGCVMSYTFNNLTENHTIAATFLPPPTEVFVDAAFTPGSAGGHAFGYDAFASIQPAVDIVAVGGTVHVASGTYATTLTLNKTLSLLGSGAASTTIDGGGGGGACITLSANGCTVKGFTFTNSQNCVAVGGNMVTVKNCAFTSYSQNGVKVLNKDYAVIQNNNFTGAAGTSGVLLSGAQQCAVSGNTISGNDVNVKVVASTSPVRSARNNTIHSNTLLNPGLWSVVSDPVLNKVNFNVFSTAGTSNRYVQNTSPTVVLNAEYNWFGGENPPNGSDFSGNVDTTHYFATNPTLFINPVSQYIPVSSPVTVTVSGMLPAGIYAKGSSVTLSWTNDAAIPDVTVPVDGGFFDDGVGPVLFAFDPLTGSSVNVDQALLNNTPPGGVGEPALFPYPYIGDLFSMTFQPVAGGISTMTLSGILLRSPDNTPLTVDIGPAAVLTADAASPSVSNVVIHNQTLTTDDPSVNGTGQDDYVKNGDAVRVTAGIDDDNPLTSADIVADLTPFGGTSGVNPTFFDDNTHVAYWDFNPLSGTGNATLTIPVAATDVVYNSTTASDDITSDNLAPTPPTGFVSKTDNTTHGHEKVALSWTAGTDAHYKSAVIRYNTWSYPTYPAGSTPGYPANALDGAAVPFAPLNATSTVHNIASRNVYYYGAFTVDWAGNYSTATAAEQQDRSANYFPGDLGSGANPYPGTAYDGRVNFDDLVWFSNFYFTNSPFVNNGGEVDFGPTSSNKTYGANHRLGIPTPDGHVDFEDLMIFSMNYMNTTPKITEPPDRQLAREFALELIKTRTSTSQGEALTVTVRVATDGRALKGVATQLNFDPSALQFVDATSGGLFGTQQQGFFFSRAENNTVAIDAAVLGVDRTVDFSGNLAVVRFRVLQAGQGDVTIEHAMVRNGDNNEELPVLNNNAVPPPTVFNLAQNYPNPFNPTTRINYQVPVTSQVTIEVFNVLGERIATLLNEVKNAGYYNALWNGRNSVDQQVASGLYFYTMHAGDFTNVKKMMLLK